MKKIKDLCSMSDDQLKNRLRQIRNSLMRARGRNTIAPSDRQTGGDVKFIRRLRKDQARILTILSERKQKREEKRRKK